MKATAGASVVGSGERGGTLVERGVGGVELDERAPPVLDPEPGLEPGRQAIFA